MLQFTQNQIETLVHVSDEAFLKRLVHDVFEQYGSLSSDITSTITFQLKLAEDLGFESYDHQERFVHLFFQTRPSVTPHFEKTIVSVLFDKGMPPGARLDLAERIVRKDDFPTDNHAPFVI